MTLEERLTELEIRYTHHVDLVEQLSAVVAEQSSTLALLRDEMNRIAERQALREEGYANGTHELPPHY